MQTIPNPTANERFAFASRVTNLREAIVEKILALAGLTGKTLLATMMANQFVDFLESASFEPEDESLILWAKALLDKHPNAHTVNKLLVKGIPAVEKLLDEQFVDYWQIKPDLQEMHRNIVLLTNTSLSPRACDQANTIDQIDARIDDLITKLDTEDAATAEHSRSVSLWCSRIAKRMGLNRQESMLVMRGGLIHDIGKMLTPKEILHAPRALDEREWRIMKEHVLAGVTMIEKIPELKHLIPTVRGHHERFDGKGYPDSKQGAEIDFLARIVTVADAFNAMIARRPYRLPFSPLVALEELKRHRSSQFDPRIVEAMIDVVVNQDE
ncbi:MAG: HD-GYP domain-containing protein [Candidatus Eremiobacteraeota bacterium]|nr:HD-GYP domain-containing protein [Candidatus Eremiobacteraeota bacterium]